jgi:hypothetical protein
MTLPLEYTYNPKLWMILLNYSTGAVWVALNLSNPREIWLWIGLVPLVLALFMTLRRAAFRRVLRLDTDALVVPSGPFRLRPTLVRYVDIERVWETRLPFTVVLSISTKTGKVEVVSSMLAHRALYREIATFLYSLTNSGPIGCN